ncbi:MAG: M14 family metallopeptidase [Candidatus Aminicenantales bacterium]
MKKLAGVALLAILSALTLVAASDEITVPLRFDRYYRPDEINDALKALNKAYPALTSLEEVGKSEEGRPLCAMTVNNPKTGAPLDKPGIYVDGNIHGNEIQGGDISLYLLDYLLGNYGHNKEITELVDRICFYVVPVVNVDGRYHFMTDPNTASSNRGLRIPTDDDRDGLVDEDFPDDIDGDGNICQMRKKDPFGRFKTDPEDARLMVPVKPGEKGEWTILGHEGLDNDGDGLVNEDSEGYVDPNRNWGFDWAPPYVQSGSGEYPFSGTGMKALAEWILTKPNICVGWSFHNSGGMYLRGPSRKGLGEFPPQDISLYDFIGKQAERITPGYRYLIVWKDLYTTYGDSVEWLVQIMGAYGFVAEVFQVQTETFRKPAEKAAPTSEMEAPGMAMLTEGITDRERIKFNDHLAQGDLYKPWTPFKHPTYGDIKIGGWVKMSSRLSAPFMIKDLVHRNAMVVIFSAKHLPEVELEVTEVKALGKNLFQVRTRLANSRAVPTMSYLAQKVNLYPKDVLNVSGAGAKVVAGGLLTDPYRDQVTYKKHNPETQFLVVPGFGKIEHQFLVEGKGEIKVSYASRHGGKRTKAVVLK